MVFKQHFVKPLTAIIFALGLAAPSFATSSDQDLIYRAFFGDANEIIELVDKGANPAAINKDGVPAICLAATRKGEKGLEVIKALLASGVPVDQPDSNGQSALFYAARVGNLEAVTLLLESGADYYHADNHQNIARNIAYQRGYMDVFSAMDNFINNKRDAVLQEYDDRGKKLVEAERKLEEQKARIAQQEEELKLKEEAVEDAVEHLSAEPINPPPAEPKEAAPEPEVVEKAPLDEAAFGEAIRALSYHACQMQYWHFVKSSRLATSLSGSELTHKVMQHRDATKAQQVILEGLSAGEKYSNKIVKPSKDRIYQELDRLGSNITRKSHGIGEEADAEKRCNDIADSWLIEMPEG